jgi:hypothetical protein
MITDITMRTVTYQCERCTREEKRSGRVEDANDWVRYPDGWLRCKLFNGDGNVVDDGDLCTDCVAALAEFMAGAELIMAQPR